MSNRLWRRGVVKAPWSNSWKTQCKERIKSCDCVIVLVTANAKNAEGVHWEVKFAKNESMPIMAMYAKKEHKHVVLSPELKGLYVYKWSWKNIENFIEKIN